MTGRQLFKTSAATALGYGRILVFGTDEDPDHLDTVVGRYEAMLDACKVPEESRRKVFGETLAKILSIKVRA
jgi:hypothetical protein